ncbi:MAG: hypothetical protein INR68_02180 [Methylobacterium mesophilicum]|nr:hypothetical protein [Methylobacterium mesophilicum]
MAGNRQNGSWFASLRRDGILFAALSALLLLFAGLQTTVPANASGLVICTGGGARHDPLQTPADKDCVHCLGNSACGGPSIVGKLLPSGTAGLAPHRPAGSSLSAIALAACDPLPARGRLSIRAPPFTV